MTGPGIVKSETWIMNCEGDESLYVWSPRWEVITDKGISERLGIEGFRSSEKWQLLGYDEKGTLRIVLPGCQVKSWLACEKQPTTKRVLKVGGA